MADTTQEHHDDSPIPGTSEPEKMPYSHRNLRRIRKQRKLSQKDLAKLSGVSRMTIQSCESRADANPTYQVLLALGKALNVIWDADWQGDSSRKIPPAV